MATAFSPSTSPVDGTSVSSNSVEPSYYLTLPLTPNAHITIQPFSHTPLQLRKTLFDLSHPVTNIWPDFILEGPTESNTRFQNLMVDERWLPFQLVAILHPTPASSPSSSISTPPPGARIIGQANSLPFHWPTPNDSSTLPDRGWDGILAMGSFPEKAPGPANALSALSVAIDPKYRANKLKGIDLATEMLKGLRAIAKKSGFEALVVPVRPTGKGAAGNVWVDMDAYVRCRRGEDPASRIGRPRSKEGLEGVDHSDVYDPWLRKHLEMGAKMVKVCWKSTIIERAIEDWERWTGVSFKIPSVNPYRCIRKREVMEVCKDGEEESYEVVIPGGLVPVKVFPHKKFVQENGEEKIGVGLYVEPNVWMRHF